MVDTAYSHKNIFHLLQYWNKKQTQMLNAMEEEESVRFSGDGRYDSTGHLAKYMSYSLINMKTGLVTIIKLVQVILRPL